jgi:hypothetical protein
MLVSSISAGERRIFPGISRADDKRLNVSFTLLCVDWFPSPTVPGAFFHGAMGVTGAGVVAILDPIILEFTQPLLALPAPATAS